MPNTQPDFTGWATVYGVKCTDGRTIKHGAFDDMDGAKVPLVWQHQHDDPENVIGYAILHSVPDTGMACDGYLNDSVKGNQTRLILEHGDVDSLSIYANHLRENSSKEVFHGEIKEVSVVLCGANSKARVDYTSLHHADMSLEEMYSDAIIYNDVHFEHGDDGEDGIDEGDDYEEGEDDLDLGLFHADDMSEDESYGIESSQDLIDAYGSLEPDEMDLVNKFLAYFAQDKEPSQEEVNALTSMIESKDKPTQVKLLTMLLIAREQ